MAIAENIVQDATPNLQELSVGTNVLFHGNKPWTHGVPAGRIPANEPLTPARIIVRSARRVVTDSVPNGLDAYAVFQQGRPTLPSVIFEVNGSDLLDTLDSSRPVRVDYLIIVRAETYEQLEDLTMRLMHELNNDPSGRVREVGAGLDDGFSPDFNFRTRSFNITVQL